MTRETERVLAVLLRDVSRPRYGRGIGKEADLPRASVYGILVRSESAGWLESAWEHIDPAVEKRPARRHYWLTPQGERVAREALRATRAHLRGLGDGRPELGKA